jgi:hypothetical protein
MLRLLKRHLGTHLLAIGRSRLSMGPPLQPQPIPLEAEPEPPPEPSPDP